MSKTPTAEDFLDKKFPLFEDLDNGDIWGNIEEVMVEFARMHVEAALKAADEKATVTPIDHEEISEGSFRPIWGVDGDSILNSYPLENIK